MQAHSVLNLSTLDLVDGVPLDVDTTLLMAAAHGSNSRDTLQVTG